MSVAEIIDARTVEDHVMALASHGAFGETGVWRTVYSPEWSAAQDLVASWCAELGLEVSRDAVGNIWGRLEGTEGGPSIVAGSHVDSQTPGGRYDGALGVVAAVLAVQALKERYGPPRRTMEVVSLCEEESSRFRARFWGSRAIVGGIEPHEPDALFDDSGISIAEAMRSVGLDPARIPEAARADIDSFLELHIEQGPILEDAGLPVGLVRAITGLRHTSIELVGRSDHAGARPMASRLDPMAGAAEVISGAVGDALRMGPPAVTTIGKMAVEPNLTSTVPDRVTFTIDARHPDPEPLALLYRSHQTLISSVAERRGLEANTRILLDFPPCVCDPDLVRLLEAAAGELGIPAMRMHSGAGHDSQQMAARSKVGMVFVRSIGGRSHTPAEYTTADDAAKGIQVLATTMHELAY
jgi:allantoate deiminase